MFCWWFTGCAGRHLHSIILVDGKTGSILWTMGGKRNDFVELEPAGAAAGAGDPETDPAPPAPVLSFAWQHHARFVPGTNETEMTLFDNHVKATTHGTCRGTSCSRGLRVAVDAGASPPAVRLLREFRHPSRLQAQSQGSVQVLSASVATGGEDEEGEGAEMVDNVFVGWGRCPSFTEHAPSGEVVMDVQFSPWHSGAVPDALDNYRAYKMDWVATPWWGPAVALRRVAASSSSSSSSAAAAAAADVAADGELAVYVSWNGATEVREWVVRGAEGEGEGKVQGEGDILAVSARTGFETRLTVGMGGFRWLWAEALDRDGKVIGSTEALDLADGGGGNLTLLSESEESEGVDWISPAAAKTTGMSASTWAWLVGGLIGLVLAVAAGLLVWRRQRDYNRLEGDDDMVDIPEAYEDYNSGPRLGI